MAERSCFDFDLLIGRSGERYRAQVVRSPAGEGQAVLFDRPFSELELENFLLKIGRPRVRTRRVEAAPVAAAKQFGGRLFSAVFTGPVGECLRRSADRAQGEDATLRIRLRLSDCPELADIPWEFLYDQDDDWFVALSGATPVVRYVQVPAQPRPVRVTLPLRILVIRSEPADCGELDLVAEWAQVEAALGDLAASGAVTFTSLPAATLSELRRVLQREQFHVLHYMGHGAFTERDGGTLLFADQAGRSVPVTGERLSVMLRDHTSLRLAVLNACEAGRTDPADPFGGIADTLVRRGIPAVIAMQFEISDKAAIEFTPALYGALAAGLPVDAAVAEARKAIYAISPLEWATPVLHLRADNAHLFDIASLKSLGGADDQGFHQADDPAAESERLAGIRALNHALGEHIRQVSNLRSNYLLDTSSLLSSNISTADVPAETRDQVASLHSRIRSIIEQVAWTIENSYYRATEDSVQRLPGRTERDRAARLVRADKATCVSYETFRLTVDYLSELNGQVLDTIEGELSPQRQNQMMFGNAIMIFEFADFTIGFIQGFTSSGLTDLEALHAETSQRIGRAKAEGERLAARALQDDIEPSARDSVLDAVRRRNAALEVFQQEWQSYIGQARRINERITELQRNILILKVIRDNARLQLDVLELTTMLNFLRQSDQALRAELSGLRGLRLAPLTPDRVRRLLLPSS
jgi:hypothetical protein